LYLLAASTLTFHNGSRGRSTLFVVFVPILAAQINGSVIFPRCLKLIFLRDATVLFSVREVASSILGISKVHRVLAATFLDLCEILLTKILGWNGEDRLRALG
jgi:hypothetical protein